MAFPNTLDNLPTSMQGTTDTALVPSLDHGLMHRELGTSVNAIEQFLGTNSGTNVFNGYTAGQFPVPANSGGTLQQIITKGTINNSILGTPSITGGTYNNGVFGTAILQAPTINGQGTNSGTITNGVYNNATLGTPSLQIPYRARAYLGTTMGTVATNTEFKILLDTIDYDSGTNFNLGSHRFIAPVSGYYMVTGVTSFPDGQGTNGGRWATEIRKNGTNMQFSITHLSNSNGISAQAAGIFQLAANDFIELYAYNLIGRDAGAVGGSMYNSLAVHLLSV